MADIVVNREFLVEKIEKYSIEKDKANKGAKRALFIFGGHAIIFICRYLGILGYNLDESLIPIEQVLLTATGTASLWAAVVSVAIRSGLEGRINELEGIIKNLANNNNEQKGLSR